ncbi:hypothetical protein [Aestuariicoccus sp. MJ-SS9]|uniref:hypothetical protein n=1 Tax=Aestuariicoccus sp. MJ-SS9 TaxID=3079855 RepID=UPI00290FAB3C|nr:hypothetical protein [Aestuariicoccus sp. MJ-SS9]MDU8911327.1 hypothetical protein [Aestuariicoccus sp. MJ-SS9]
MPARTIYAMIANMSDILKELEGAGMRLEIGDDFIEYRRLRQAQENRHAIYPMFDVSCSYVDHTNAFWICGFNEKDELVHTQAMRFLDISGETLGQHVKRHRHKYITPNTTPDPDRTFYSGPRGLKAITGKVCYHGEFWLCGGEGGYRKKGYTPLLSRIAFELALKSWAPNYVFGFINSALAFKGTQMHHGYIHCEPGEWVGPDDQVTDEDCLVWMNTREILHVLQSKPKALLKDRETPLRKPELKSVGTVS